MKKTLFVLLLVFGLLVFGCVKADAEITTPGDAMPPTTPSTPAKTVAPTVYPGLTESDFPGFKEVALSGGSLKKLEDFPAEIQDKLADYGFEYSHMVVLQKPLWKQGDILTDDFRQLQSTVIMFSDASGATRAYNEDLELAQSNGFTITPIDSIGDKAFFYLVEYTDASGSMLEQHFLYFTKNRGYAKISVTATNREDSSELSNLLAEAADKVHNRMQ